MNTPLLLFGAVFALVGLAFAYAAYRELRRRREVADTPTTPIGAARAGRLEIAGVAEAGPAGLVKSPITGLEALHVAYVIEEQQRDRDGDTKWRDVDRGHAGAPFVLRDETGAILVDAADADLRVRETTTPLARDAPGGSGGSGMRVQLGGPGISLQFGSRPRRVRESAILPGDRLYVLGEAHAARDGDPAPFVLRNGDDKLLLSTKSEAQLLRSLLLRALLFGGIGILMLGGAAWAIPAGLAG